MNTDTHVSTHDAAEDIRNVAQAYLTPARSVTGWLSGTEGEQG